MSKPFPFNLPTLLEYANLFNRLSFSSSCSSKLFFNYLWVTFKTRLLACPVSTQESLNCSQYFAFQTNYNSSFLFFFFCNYSPTASSYPVATAGVPSREQAPLFCIQYSAYPIKMLKCTCSRFFLFYFFFFFL